MGKTFNYTKKTGHYYCSYSDEWEDDGVEFEYEVENKDLLPVLVDLMFDDYFGDDTAVKENKELTRLIKEKLKYLIDEQDLVSMLADNYEDTLKDIFEEEAMEWYNG